MRFTPRGPEVKRVVAVLESEEFETPEAMAKAVIKEVVDLLSFRDTYAGTLRLKDGEHGLNFGPFYSAGDVKSYVSSLAVGGTFGVAPLHAPAPIKANIEGLDDTSPWCLECGHPAYAHLADGSSRGGCGLSYCDCTKYKK